MVQFYSNLSLEDAKLMEYFIANRVFLGPFRVSILVFLIAMSTITNHIFTFSTQQFVIPTKIRNRHLCIT